jgi:hypothetical protein
MKSFGLTTLYILGAASVWVAANVAAQKLYPTSHGDDFDRRVVYRVICLVMFFIVCGGLSLVWLIFTNIL